jgi:hypothetical protein
MFLLEISLYSRAMVYTFATAWWNEEVEEKGTDNIT